ncbi:alanine racemase [Saliphagus sp. LR7]|uniref:alanine racemase n=1 Tax=Saliphagus sp. LR7 TaxID=2282654 RepID=UPI001E4DD78F|nr:alanine racemase [Saliphagus sp. LR7]
MRPPSDLKPDLFETTDEIETPAILVDLDAMERNMAKYASFAKEQRVALRSHVKTHKIPDLAHRQEELTGGDGIVCQKLSEAEVMAQNGIDDIYLTYMVVGEEKLNRLVWLSEHVDEFATTVDGEGNILPLQEAAARHGVTVDVVLELDVGLNRVGVQPGAPATEVADLILEQPNLNLAGIMAYEAHVTQEAETASEYERLCMAVMDEVEEAVDRIEDVTGAAIDEVKVGGTATSKFSGRHPVVTEINPGMYPFNDVGELGRRPFEVDKEDCALTVLTSVISTAADDRVIVDGGSKTMSMDLAAYDIYPLPKNRDDIAYERYSEEHGWIDTSESNEEFTVGDRLEFIAPHVCTTINLHDTIVGVRDGVVKEVWEVQARGKLK